uniref:ATP-grasp domain-containing protein n=2 Tax=Plectus sambesii TaxID=2011161 RepID=A0A914UW17_9BILA
MSLLSTDTLHELERLNNDCKGIVGILIKWRYPFFTDIRSLVVPPNSALVGVFGTPLRRHMDTATVEKFAHVIYYNTDYEKALEGGAHTDEISLPEIAQAIKEIVAIVDCKKLRLIVWEEMLVYFVANLRESFGIPGPTNAELEKIRDKRSMKECALERGIPTAPFLVLSDLANTEEAKTRIESVLSYPLFVKPIYGVASAGNARLNNQEELMAWLLATKNKGHKETLCISQSFFYANL